jgi:hypothetical protein
MLRLVLGLKMSKWHLIHFLLENLTQRFRYSKCLTDILFHIGIQILMLLQTVTLLIDSQFQIVKLRLSELFLIQKHCLS